MIDRVSRKPSAHVIAMLYAGALGLALVACDRGAKPAEQAAKTGADTGAMADMPGMKTDAKGESAESPARDQVTLTAAQIRNGRVQWEAVAMGPSAAVVTVPGQLVPNEDRTARLGAPAGGRIIAVAVRPGDRVARGQAVATLQSPEAGAAQSDLAKAEAEVTARRAQATYARSARDRAERLLALKAIPRQDYDRAIADDELARSALSQADAELRRARSTAHQLGAEGSGNGEIVVRSPLDGTALERTGVPGSVVEAGAPLVVVTDPSSLWLTVDAPEALAPLFRIGATLRFTVSAFGAQSFAARIDAVGAGLSPDRRTLPIRATVANASGRLKPEMLATVLVETTRSVQAVVLPDDAVQLLDGKTVVFIAKPADAGGARFTARQVDVGARSGGRAAIVRGLSAGEIVVTHGAFAVKGEIKKGSMPEME
jgi:membrane fusion protein, heavy metal efflux system